MIVSNAENVLEVQNVSRYFGRKGNIVTALQDISLNVISQQNIALVGETGSGKTTLGRISCGLETPSKGNVILSGKDIRKYKKHELWKVTQYIHQDPYGAIDSLETVRGILERPLKFLIGIRDPKERDYLLVNSLISSGLSEDYLDKKGSDLSGGEKQRVLIARAFIVNPKYVVVDEPTTMIDFIHRDEVIQTLKNEGNQYGATLMLITHDITIVPKIAKKVAVLYKGKIIESGDTKEILKNPLHPYTSFLTSIQPENLLGNRKLTDILDEYGGNKYNLDMTGKGGCQYAPLCPLADNKCRMVDPPTVEVVSNHFVKCFKPGEFRL